MSLLATDFVPPVVLIVSCILHVHVTTDYVPPVVSCILHVHVATDFVPPVVLIVPCIHAYVTTDYVPPVVLIVSCVLHVHVQCNY